MVTAFALGTVFVLGTFLSATNSVAFLRRIQIRVLIHPFHLYHAIWHKTNPMTTSACTQSKIVMTCKVNVGSSDILDLSRAWRIPRLKSSSLFPPYAPG